MFSVQFSDLVDGTGDDGAKKSTGEGDLFGAKWALLYSFEHMISARGLIPSEPAQKFLIYTLILKKS